MKYSFEGFNQISTTMALAELQATEALEFRLNSFQSAKIYLSEMRQRYSNAGAKSLKNIVATHLKKILQNLLLQNLQNFLL